MTYMIEFYGNVPADVQYLKLLPYNAAPIGEIIGPYTGNPEDYVELDPNSYYLESKAYINDLPRRFRQSEYGSITIESIAVTEQDITLTYKHEGIVISHFITVTNGEHPIPNLSFTLPIYNRHEDLYTLVYTVTRPVENLQDKVKELKVIQYDIELLEEQAIIIPLR